jgi:hypothetical protein
MAAWPEFPARLRERRTVEVSMRFRTFLLLLMTLAVPSVTRAQSLPVTVFTELKDGVVDIFAVWISPFRGEPRDYLTAGMLMGGAGVVALADDGIGRWIYRHPEHGVLVALEPFREKSDTRLVDLGGAKHLLTVTGTLYVAGLVFRSPSVRAAAVGCMASVQAGVMPRMLIYRAVSRERPLFIEPRENGEEVSRRGDPWAIRTPGEESWYDNSFFAGHGANIMACASFLNHRFELGIAEPLLWTVATGVNLGRMADQRHWATDVFIGAAVGFAMGKYVAERSSKRQQRRNADDAERQERDLLSGLYVDWTNGAAVIGIRRTF